MTVGEVAELIEKLAPKSFASEWDNVGLMIGSADSVVKKVLISLDVTPSAVAQAIENRCDMILSHHPFFFNGFKCINYDTQQGNLIKTIIENNIAVYSCHTNMDSANGGINTLLAEMFALENLSVLECNPKISDIGIGRIGNLKKPCTLSELCSKTKSVLSTPFVRVVANDMSKNISAVCVASGSCGDLIALAKSKGADVIITADVKYHQGLYAKESDIAVIDAGHFPTEFIVLNIFEKLLKNSPVEIVRVNEKDVFQIM